MDSWALEAHLAERYAVPQRDLDRMTTRDMRRLHDGLADLSPPPTLKAAS